MKRRRRMLLVYLIFLIIFAELFARTYLTVVLQASFWDPATLIYQFYPKLQQLERKKIVRRDDDIDILLLGASVFDNGWGDIGPLLQNTLRRETRKHVNIHNLSVSGRSSLDSYYKYRHLTDKEFDFVLLYHSINEIRANNCPPSVFKDDYSHYLWYRGVNAVHKHPELRFFAFPFALRLGFMTLNDQFHPPEILSINPLAKWIDYGEEIKTTPALVRNFTRIIDLAKQRNDPLLLMTFAYYVPNDYSLETFKQKALDYGGHRSPIEVWGKPENVIKGLDAHNIAIHEIAQKHPNIYFIDMNAIIPKQGKYFGDICHFTRQGSQAFVNAIVPSILKGLQKLK